MRMTMRWFKIGQTMNKDTESLLPENNNTRREQDRRWREKPLKTLKKLLINLMKSNKKFI